MKIVFTTSGTDINAPLDSRFGRSPRFLVYDMDNATFEVVDNQHLSASHGAGIQAAQTVVDTGAEAVITGHCGPKAFRVLQAGGIEIFHTDATTVAEALAAYREGRLNSASTANRRGHEV